MGEPSSQNETEASSEPQPAGARRKRSRGGGLPGWADVLLRVGWLLIAAAVVWVLGLNLYVDIGLAVLLVALAIRADKPKLLALLVSSFFALGLVELATRVLTSTGQVQPYFRPHEQLAHAIPGRPYIDPPPPRYHAKANVTFDMPHGDLAAVVPYLAGAIREPRTVRFVTDAWGFRNDAEYAGQPYLIAGDSLAVCNGSDQGQMLVNVLRDEHRIFAYSVAHPADPDQYFDNLGWAFRQLRPPPQTRALVFVFEGNDFVARGQRLMRPMPMPSWYDQRKLWFVGRFGNILQSTGYLFGMSRRLERVLFPRGDEIVELHHVGQHRMVFLGSCVDAARSDQLQLLLTRLIPMWVVQRIAVVFLVPTKYRVYAPLFDDGRGKPPIPSAALLALHHAFGPLKVPVVDLTPALTKRAAELLPEGRYVYWRDDTHWNPDGIRAAARAVAQHLRNTSPK